MLMKHRTSKIKRQHSIIKGLQDFLERHISTLEYVTGVIPGEIKVSKATGGKPARKIQIFNPKWF